MKRVLLVASLMLVSAQSISATIQNGRCLVHQNGVIEIVLEGSEVHKLDFDFTYLFTDKSGNRIFKTKEDRSVGIYGGAYKAQLNASKDDETSMIVEHNRSRVYFDGSPQLVCNGNDKLVTRF